MNRTRKLLVIVALYLSLPLLLFFTSPENLPLPLIVLPFILLGVVIYMTSYLLMARFRPDMAKVKRAVLSVLIAIAPVLLLTLRSIHQLSIQDIVLVVVLLVGLTLYLKRIDLIG